MSVNNYVAYNAAGKIVAAFTSEASNLVVNTPAGSTAVIGLYDSNETYFVGGVATTRVSLDSICTFTNTGGWSANGTDTIVYGTTLPNPSAVTITSTNRRFIPVYGHLITDGTLTLRTSKPGNYVITIVAFPYLDKVITVTAT